MSIILNIIPEHHPCLMGWRRRVCRFPASMKRNSRALLVRFGPNRLLSRAKMLLTNSRVPKAKASLAGPLARS